MQRIENLSTNLTEVGMWAKVVININDEIVEGVIGRLSDAWLCFVCNNSLFDGNNMMSEYLGWDDIRRDYNYGWCIRPELCGNLSLASICASRGFDYGGQDISFVGVLNSNNELVQCDGRTRKMEQIKKKANDYDFFLPTYERTMIYSGIHSYHHHHGVTQNKPTSTCRGHKIGVELEVEFTQSSYKETWRNKAKSNWFYCERDGSLNDYGVEIITVPMRPTDIKSPKTWEQLIHVLSGKAKSWDSSRCGLHVHIGREILGSNAEQQSETIGKLLYLYHQHLNGTSMNTKIFGRSRAYNEKDGKTEEGAAVATLGSAVLKLKEIKDKLKDGLITKSRSDRYFDINLQNTHTIEFRKGRGSIKTSRIIMVIEYCELMCKYAKAAKWEEISKENFVEYIVSNIKKDSPLYAFFEAGERCDFSF